jgi:rhodanese-related sulfurtransferase
MTKEINTKQLLEMLERGVELVDVREAEELREGKIDDTKHWPLSSFGLRQKEISKTRPTVFYCRTGLRSLKAAEIAADWTKQDVFSLQGGFLAYNHDKTRDQ